MNKKIKFFVNQDEYEFIFGHEWDYSCGKYDLDRPIIYVSRISKIHSNKWMYPIKEITNGEYDIDLRDNDYHKEVYDNLASYKEAIARIESLIEFL
jgi:hypothetical protein